MSAQKLATGSTSTSGCRTWRKTSIQKGSVFPELIQKSHSANISNFFSFPWLFRFVRPELVFNVDETMLSSKSHTKVKVFFPKDMRCPFQIGREKEALHITMVFCIGADGSYVRPTAILPQVTLPELGCDITTEIFAWAGNSSGWMDETLFAAWLRSVFIPHVGLVRKKNHLPEDEPALLWVDGHYSRNTDEAKRLLRENNIACAVLPGHTSHILQPLDCGVNRTFKHYLEKHRLPSEVGDGLSEKRAKMLRAAAKAWWFAMFPGSVQNAWKATGLFPWQPEVVRDDTGKVEVPRIEPQQPKRKKRGPKISGTVLVNPGKDANEADKEERDDKEPLGVEGTTEPRTMKCSVCSGIGHNKRTCNNLPSQQIHLGGNTFD